MKKISRYLFYMVCVAAAIFFVARNQSISQFVKKSTPQFHQGLIVQPEKIVPGDPVFITIDATSTPVSLTWDTKELKLFKYGGIQRAFVPIDFNDKVLHHVVTAKLQNGETLTKTIKITPRPKIEKPLGIPEKLGGNTPAAAVSLVDNLAKENKILNSIPTSPTILWTKPFAYPITHPIVTDDYGYDRATVDQTIVHKGTDFHALIGTPVMAMNRGIVKIARTFVVYGNAVVIDHGLGLQTLYMHMSKLNVKEGDIVEQGSILGWSGDTGYVEAPHLHISVKIDAISIDPMTFLRFFVPAQ
jgi:murein DD-endopeptidase MepM/ murein hydrolase activator NlpD